MRRILLIALIMLGGCTERPIKNAPVPVSSLAQDLPTYKAPLVPELEPLPLVDHTGDLALHQALALSLLHNPQLQAHAWDLRGAEAAVLQNRLRLNPVLGLKVENVGGNNALSGFDGAVNTLRITQAIELGDKRLKRTRLAQQQHALSNWDYEAQRLQVIAQTGHRYIDVLAATQNLKLSNQALTLAQGLYTIIKSRTVQGVAATVELDKARIQVNTRKIDLENRTRQLTALRHHLAAMWDTSAPEFGQLLGSLQDIPVLPTYAHLETLIKRNPDLARWSAEISARQAALELANTRAIPNLIVGGGVRRFNATDDDAFVFELGLPLPLVNRNQGAKRQARYNLQQAKALQRQAHANAHTTLQQMFQDLSAAHYAQSLLNNESLPAARAAFNAAQKAFTQGVTDYLNVLDAERTLIASQYEHIAALSAFHKTLMSVEAFLGTSVGTMTRTTDPPAGNGIDNTQSVSREALGLIRAGDCIGRILGPNIKRSGIQQLDLKRDQGGTPLVNRLGRGR